MKTIAQHEIENPPNYLNWFIIALIVIGIVNVIAQILLKW